MEREPHRGIKDLITVSVDTSVQEPFGTYLFDGNDPGAEIARDLERSVFLEAFGNTPELLHNEYNRYEPASLFFCVIDHRRKVCAGMMRVIVPIANGPGLKSLVDIEPIWGQPPKALFEQSGLKFEPESMWDMATLAVAPDYRTAASLGLMHIGMYQAIARLGRYFEVKWLVAIQNYAVYRLVRLQLRRAFVAYGEERSYLGTDRNVPSCCALEEAERETRANDPTLHELIYVGSTLKAALRQIDLDQAINTVRDLFDRARRDAN